MHKDLIHIPCPCCGKQIEVDTRNGRARAVVPGEGKASDLDQLLQSQKQQHKRLTDAFDTARQREKDKEQVLDDLLQQAKEEARQNPDEDIRRPFDLE